MFEVVIKDSGSNSQKARKRREDREKRKGADWYDNENDPLPDREQMGEEPAIDRPNFGMPKEQRKKIATAVLKRKMKKK